MKAPSGFKVTREEAATFLKGPGIKLPFHCASPFRLSRTFHQIELNRKRESELAKLKEDYNNNSLQHETILANLRQKHNAVIADLGEQIDQLNKAKTK